MEQRLALRRMEAAQALGLSAESFDRYVRAHLPCVRVGSLSLYPVKAIRQWLEREQVAPVDDLESRL